MNKRLLCKSAPSSPHSRYFLHAGAGWAVTDSSRSRPMLKAFFTFWIPVTGRFVCVHYRSLHVSIEAARGWAGIGLDSLPTSTRIRVELHKKGRKSF